MERIKGPVFVALLYLSSTFGSQFFLIPLLPLIFINMALCRRCMDFMLACWKVYAVALYELMFGIELVYSGDCSPPPDGAIIIMNHRTRLDWIYLFAYEIRYGSLLRGKVVLKNSLKHIPGPGWAMQCGLFMFLRRRWDVDRLSLTQVVHYCRKLAYKPQILIFPEGTDLTPNSIAKSSKFADSHGLPHYRHVLHPRTTGFSFLVDSMTTGNLLGGISDITIAYPDRIPQDEVDALYGKFPAAIHFHVKHHPLENLPKSKELREDWCQKIWQEKENRLAEFYMKKQFCGEKLPDKRGEIRWILIAALLLWTSFVLLVLYGLFVSSFIRWYVFLTVLVFLSVEVIFGGVDSLQTMLALEGSANNNDM